MLRDISSVRLERALEHFRARRFEEAASECASALAEDPDHAGLHRLRGDILHTQARLDEAIAAYAQALEIDPFLHPAWYALGCAALSSGDFAAAARSLERAVELETRHAPSHHNLGKALFKLGLTDEAIACFRRSLSLADSFHARTAIATLIPGSPQAGNASILQARREWAGTHLAPPPHPPPREPAAGRRLRIGYLSSFFHCRNWMKPVWGLLHHHDRESFEIHLFHDGPAPERIDERDRLHDLSELSNAEAAASIERNRIDVLVDLNGYSAVTRLAVPAQKPAPVIAGWFNLYATSGMACYDYLIGDGHVIPYEEEVHYTEKVVRLPGCYLAFDVRYPVPDVVDPPCSRPRTITFGCLASQYKITPEVVAAWSAILRQSPQARLFVKNGTLDRRSNREHLLARFAAQGIAAERIELEGPSDHFEFLAAYGRIDLALDTFPYNGGTTTSEALWQGVPVVCFQGDRWAARQSASILCNGGLSEFVARDLDGYIALAVRAAANAAAGEHLTALRRGMRSRLAASPLCDTAGLARAMEEKFREFSAGVSL